MRPARTRPSSPREILHATASPTVGRPAATVARARRRPGSSSSGCRDLSRTAWSAGRSPRRRADGPLAPGAHARPRGAGRRRDRRPGGASSSGASVTSGVVWDGLWAGVACAALPSARGRRHRVARVDAEADRQDIERDEQDHGDEDDEQGPSMRTSCSDWLVSGPIVPPDRSSDKVRFDDTNEDQFGARAARPAEPERPAGRSTSSSSSRSATRSAAVASRRPPRSRRTRALAGQLGVSRGIVVEAYEQLVAEGYLASRPGGLTQVARTATAATSRPHRPAAVRFEIDFRPGRPDVDQFPRAAWLRSVRRVLNETPSERFGYLDGRGTPELRGAVTDYLNRARGASADAEDVVVCTGFAQGLRLATPGPPRRRRTASGRRGPVRPGLSGGGPGGGSGRRRDPGRRRRAAGRPARRQPMPTRPRHRGPPVPDRRRPPAGAPGGARRLGDEPTRGRHRGRLRRRVPVRP